MAEVGIGFIISSETISTTEAVMVDSEEELSGQLRRYAMYPLDTSLASLIARVFSGKSIGGSPIVINGVIERGRHVWTSIQARQEIRQLTGVDGFYCDALVVFVMPSVYDVIATAGMGDPQLADIIEGVAATDPVGLENATIDVANSRPELTLEESAVVAALRAYRLYTAGVVGRADNSKNCVQVGEIAPGALDGFIDGLIEQAAPAPVTQGNQHLGGMDEFIDGLIERAAPAVEQDTTAIVGNVPRIPFAKFALNDRAAENCLIDALIERYARLPSSRSIAEKSIRKWFIEDNGGTSLYRLREFADRYEIPLRVYDITGAEIFSRKNSGKTGKRPGMAIMAYANHAYIYEGQLNAEIDLSKQPEHDVVGFRDTRDPSAATLALLTPDNSAAELAAFDEILKMGKPNFFFAAEEAVGCRSLMWNSLETPAPDGESQSEGWDMNKAFHTAVVSAKDTEKIPVFTVLDDIEPFDPAIDRVQDHGYYFVRKSAFDAWRTAPKSHVRARLNNILHGFEARHLIETGQLSKADIEAQKLPTYTLDASIFRATLKRVADASGVPEELRPRFALYNGLLGITRSSSHTIAMAVTESDAALLSAVHPGARVEKCPAVPNVVTKAKTPETHRPEAPQNGETRLQSTLRRMRAAQATRDRLGQTSPVVPAGAPIEERASEGPSPQLFSVKIPVAKGRYLYLNNRHLYNWVVARTNLLMMRFIDSWESQGRTVLKIKVDGVVFSRPLPVQAIAGFKREPVRLQRYGYERTWIDSALVTERVRDEIKTFINCKCEIVTGAPGTGKTFKIKADGKYDFAMALTNVCARNLDTQRVKADTIHSTLRLFDINSLGDVLSKLRGRVLWLDEFSMVNAWIWSELFVIGSLSARLLIVTGDPDQLPPINEDLPYACTFMSTLLGAATHLTDEHRNDTKLVKLRKFINENADSRVEQFMADLVRLSPNNSADAKDLGELSAIETHITLTRRTRDSVNRAVANSRGMTFKYRKLEPAKGKAKATGDEDVEAAKPELAGAKKAAKPTYQFVASQGLKLRARITRKTRGIYKGAIYILETDVRWTTVNATLRQLGKGPDDAPIVIAAGELSLFELGYATTVASSQGLTVQGPLAIHEVGLMLTIDKRNLYTAVTRGKRYEDLCFSLGVPPAIREFASAGATLTPEIPLTEIGGDEEPGLNLGANLSYSKGAGRQREASPTGSGARQFDLDDLLADSS